MKKLKKKKIKGFTLVELIAVIAILGVVLTIAGISIVSIRKNINEKQQLNLQATLKAAAQGYHDDTGVSIVPVGVLLQIGAVQADTTNYEGDGFEKGDPVILDPVDGQPINCDAIVYNEEGEAEYVPDKGCSTEAIEENSLQLQVQIGASSPVVYNPENWIKLDSTTETVKFIPILSTSDELEYTWTNVYSPDTSEKGKTYNLPIPDSGYVETELRLETTYNGVLLYQDFEVKVDAKNPVITNDGIVDPDEWRKSKTIVATLTDAESGLSGYKLLKESGNCATDGTWKDLIGKLQEVSEVVTENGNYKFCVKDIAGHTAETKSGSLKVSKIDNTPPKISVSVENGEVYSKAKTGTITFTEVGDDEPNTVGFGGDQLTFKYGWSLNANAACSTLDHTGTFSPAAGSKTSSTTVTINGETGAGYLIVCAVDIHDALGNAMDTTSSVKAKMYLDNTGPECGKATGSSTTWTNSDRTIKQACSDPQSGCAKASYDKTYTTTTKTDSVVISDKLGNTTTCSYNVYVDKTVPVCTNATGSSTTWTNKDRTIKQACSDADSGCAKATFDKTYTTTTVTSSITIKDVAGNEASCPVNVYVDKEAPECGKANGSSTSWTINNRTIYQECKDTTSGCTQSTFDTTYTSTTKSSSVTIRDNAGNTESCSYNVYVDKTSPSSTISVSSQSSSYNSTGVSITVGGSDSHSGVSYYCYTTTNSYGGCSWSTSRTFTSTASSDYNGASQTFYGWTKDSVGNVSSGASSTYTVYKYCNKKEVSGYGSYGSCTKACDTGYKYRDVYYRDVYFTSHACATASNGDSTTCNTMKCCTSSTIKYKDGSSCSEPCGYGTYNRLAYSTYDNSIRCSSFDQSSGGSSCYIKACCTTGAWQYDYCDSNGYVHQKRTTNCENTSTTRSTSTGCDSSKSCSTGSCNTTCGTGTKTTTCTYYNAGVKQTSTSSVSCSDDSGCAVNCYLMATHSGSSFSPYWSPSKCAGTTSGCSGTSCTVSGKDAWGRGQSNKMCYCNGDGYYACNGGSTLSCCSGKYCLI